MSFFESLPQLGRGAHTPTSADSGADIRLAPERAASGPREAREPDRYVAANIRTARLRGEGDGARPQRLAPCAEHCTPAQMRCRLNRCRVLRRVCFRKLTTGNPRAVRAPAARRASSE